MTALSAAAPPPVHPRRRRIGLVAVATFVLAVAVMWAYALFFAPRTSPDKVPDRAWTVSAQAICVATRHDLDALPTASTFKDVKPLTEALRQRAEVLDRANDLLAAQLASLRSLRPADETTAALTGEWLADWDTYLADRRAHALELRAGKDVPFKETTYKESPMSNRMNAFARVNLMDRCGTPFDLA